MKRVGSKQTSFGFTLIELLVVVALIGVLATLVLSNINAARQRGRDAQRKADLRNIQTALRIYYNDYDKFPEGGANGEIMGCGALGNSACVWEDPFSAGSQVYMSTLPTDPLTGVDYYYQRIDPDDYLLTACLENLSDEKGVEDLGSSGWCSTNYIYQVKP